MVQDLVDAEESLRNAYNEKIAGQLQAGVGREWLVWVVSSCPGRFLSEERFTASYLACAYHWASINIISSALEIAEHAAEFGPSCWVVSRHTCAHMEILNILAGSIRAAQEKNKAKIAKEQEQLKKEFEVCYTFCKSRRGRHLG